MSNLPLADACCAPLSLEALDAAESQAFAAQFKALGDPVRLRLFSLIASAPDREVCVCDLTGHFDLTAPTISHHLKTLRTAGLIDSERRGTWIYYRAVSQTLDSLAALLRTDSAVAAR